MSTVDGSLPFTITALIIFAIVSFTFLFPLNRIVTLDRRSVAIFGATLCYVTRTFAFTNMDILQSVDFDVLVLLTSIMAINHVLIHLKETKYFIHLIQLRLRENPVKGFWIVSFTSFIVSPFLTNDGVCLLFVEIVLNSFPSDNILENKDRQVNYIKNKLSQNDSLYFLLTLACSANIGSALTYTGNPQNMIIAQDALAVMSPLQFLSILTIPSLLSWVSTTLWIQYCWNCEKQSLLLSKEKPTSSIQKKYLDFNLFKHKELELGIFRKNEDERNESKIVPVEEIISSVNSESNQTIKNLSLSVFVSDSNMPTKSQQMPLSPRRRRQLERNSISASGKDFGSVFVVSSPLPYMALALLLAMVVAIFVDAMPIAGLVCITSVLLVVATVGGNLIRGNETWTETFLTSPNKPVSGGTYGKLPFEGEEGSGEKHKNAFAMKNVHEREELTHQDRVDSVSEFFDSLFNSIDYSLLLIFLGTFIVVGNVDSTGVPRKLWSLIVGEKPFASASSIIGISFFVLVLSQMLGNVAVVQLARPNIEFLPDKQKRLAWAIISYVATIGGNLMITGSAANIIVAEKASRISSNSRFDFFGHFRICFVITLLCCIIGGFIIAILVDALY